MAAETDGIRAKKDEIFGNLLVGLKESPELVRVWSEQPHGADKRGEGLGEAEIMKTQMGESNAGRNDKGERDFADPWNEGFGLEREP